MVEFPITLNSHLVGLVDIRCIDVSRSISKSIGENIGNTFRKKYWWEYWQYFSNKVSVSVILSKSIVNNPDL